MPAPIATNEIETALRGMLSKYIGGRRAVTQTELFHNLGVAGDDAIEFLVEVETRFGTSFSGFRFNDFFPDETEALGDHVLQSIGVRSRKKPLTLGHLVRVVQAGHWSEPQKMRFPTPHTQCAPSRSSHL